MKRVVLMLALALVIPALALAGDFNFYTTGSFGSTGTNTTTLGGATQNVTITFSGTPQAASNYNYNGVTATGVTLGKFETTGNTNCTGSCTVVLSDTFTLSLYQVVPAGGLPNPGTLLGTITGSLGYNAGQGEWQLQVSNPTIAISTPDGIITRYALTQLTTDGTNGCTVSNPCVDINPSGVQTAISAKVTQVPEPASMMLMGTGLSGLAGIIRRRMKK